LLGHWFLFLNYLLVLRFFVGAEGFHESIVVDLLEFLVVVCVQEDGIFFVTLDPSCGVSLNLLMRASTTAGSTRHVGQVELLADVTT
jgi:hypothetical protein